MFGLSVAIPLAVSNVARYAVATHAHVPAGTRAASTTDKAAQVTKLYVVAMWNARGSHEHPALPKRTVLRP